MCKVARETNEELRATKADPAEAFDVGAILSIARRWGFFWPEKALGLRFRTLHWNSMDINSALSNRDAIGKWLWWYLLFRFFCPWKVIL